ncbi:pleiotropic regulator 1-like protein [Basidiobolus meristosporus CBS 931.73]|uniref:Pleiotropic regulator 1-like protein n=1 Tax=Basidiobolus meristosporus CBS 931.73 TaxID=1314790 RepID=A0A1Y1YTL3_9FUNG|nr:pleiotropic regulator 1-like protein [Basidiobolus meristosporus CBS 931.73]|eukprot:ORY01382.1 pleiotropic regulator 1-like protein [Basidiobolus meristosporus CBS 931.73]
METVEPTKTTPLAADSSDSLNPPLPSLADLVEKSAKRTRELFVMNHALPVENVPASQKVRLSVKISDEYESVKELPYALLTQQKAATERPGSKAPVAAIPAAASEPGVKVLPGHAYPTAPGVSLSEETSVVPEISEDSIQQMIENLPESKAQQEARKTAQGVVAIRQKAGYQTGPPTSSSLVRKPTLQAQRPEWHAPWKLMRVISGHLGWVRSIAVEPGNKWFATGAGDRTIKIWDLASGTLKLTLTGHISTVRGLAVSPRHPYLFSCGEDKMVKCWDLEYNKVIRHYHGHLSGVYTLSLHPVLDVLVTGGRDATARVWDMRTKQCIHVLSGHSATVADVKCQEADPQVITGSMDSMVRLWDLAAGKTMSVLTHHKKSVRALALHPDEFTFASGSSDNIKQWKCPEGSFIQNFEGHRSIVNTLAINSDNVMFSGGDNGSMYFWDWKTGYNFQKTETTVQPGSLDSESGIFASTFDRSGARLITGEADKTIKIWKEDENATEETHPLDWKPSLARRRY